MAVRLRNPGARGDARPALVASLRSVPTTIVSDCPGICVGAVGLEPFHGEQSLALCGVSLTVCVRRGDKLMIHKALTLSQPVEINVPIACAGLAVASGDLVLGDAYGVLAVSTGASRNWSRGAPSWRWRRSSRDTTSPRGPTFPSSRVATSVQT